MDRQRAKELLSMLRTRTEDRGATAAEAAQAAELAERIIRRYGLTAENSDAVTQEAELNSPQFPVWCQTIAAAIAERFKVEGHYITRRGRAAKIRYHGAEHLVSVAGWLFLAVSNDLHDQAIKAARRAGHRNGALVRFKNQFLMQAAINVDLRLHPPPPISEEWRKQLREEMERKCSSSKSTDVISPTDLNAMLAGYEAGKSVSLETNAVGANNEVQLLEVKAS